MGYSTPYLIYASVLLLFFALLHIKVVRNSLSTMIIQLTVLSFVLFFGCAGYVQTDCLNYAMVYDELPTLGNGTIDYCLNTRFGIFYVLYLSFFKTIGCDYLTYVLINIVIDACLLFYFTRRYIPVYLYPIFVLILLAYQGLELEFNLQRNTKAIFLFFISIQYIEQRRLLPFLVLNSIGFLFHWSALYFFPLYFFIHKRITQVSYFVIIAVCLVLSIVSRTIIVELVDLLGNLLPNGIAQHVIKYIDIAEYNRPSGLKLFDIERLFWAVVIGLSYNRLIAYNPKLVIILNLYCCYLLAISLGKGMMIIESRVGLLFLVSFWLLMPCILLVEKKIVKIIVGSLLVFMSFMHLYLITKSDILFEYDNWLFNEQVISLEERKERREALK